MSEFDEQGSDGCVAVVESVSEETEVGVSGEMGSKVSPNTNLEKPEESNGRSDSKSGELSDGDESDSSSESESEVSSSSYSSSSCSDEEEEEDDDMSDMVNVGEMEEGEIMDFEGDGIAGDSDAEEDMAVMKGPIKSKNELQILPPVPPVDVALEPHHQTLPVGVISSIMGTKVIVEGLEKHNPLNEGSILWITETRLPLGLVDEIFGPVKNPYYVVRYNSDKEVPAGIRNDTPVSFVEDFANLVLNNNNLYKKGYDASGENDEEVSDEFEFFDDEKEAEFRKMLRMSKQGSNGRKRGNRDFIDKKKADFIDKKKAQQKGEFQKKIHPSVPPGLQLSCGGQPPGIPNQHHTPSVAVPVGCGGFACSHGTEPGTASMSNFAPSISQVGQGQATYCMPQHLLALNNGVWANGMQSQQQPQQQQQ
ncbi:H/ACA ribonucleoprotein complex non-core subunit NAF1-like isoform X2 [Telopea speciosissima]|uniref:H/ACA ribonucleoprotein complex non-core subunit NAF1-like isoform X2 n=1 Tax=Telopea speciosissima TaxID=54955 RepID=UPI001CC5748C|nr:H/ACA ribonucleoprotein complex non-core subunit NAF1-like isoform X2 [Telopea speciosissima]